MIKFGISTSQDGPMKGNWDRQKDYLEKLNEAKKIIISANLTHSANVVQVDNILTNKIVANCDALITRDQNKILSLTVADCLPIYFYDEKQKIIALAHVGWRGVLSQIAQAVIISFKNNYKSKPEDITVIIGPHIKVCHFEVKSDLASQFKMSDIITKADRLYLDLSTLVKEQLTDVGVLAEHVYISDECTHCLKDKYFSYRRDKPRDLETMLAYITFS